MALQAHPNLQHHEVPAVVCSPHEERNSGHDDAERKKGP